MNRVNQLPEQPRRRRRGARLEADIFTATLTELRAVGYSSATFDGIARRAGVGRMSLYRRWANKPQLVAAALRSGLPSPDEPAEPMAGGLRGELLAGLASMFRAGDDWFIVVIEIAASILIEEADEELMTIIRDEIMSPRLSRLKGVFERARARGELSKTANTVLLARCGPAMLFQHVLLTDALPTEEDIVQVVDGLILPAAFRRT